MLLPFDKNRLPDIILLFIVIILVIIGILTVYSSSYIWADHVYDDRLFYVKRQLIFSVIGFISMSVFMGIPFYFWKKYASVIFLSSFILLLVVLIPGIGMVRGGAQSWIGIGSFSIQPSEFVKLGLIIYLAHYLAEQQRYILSFKKGFLIPIVLIFIPFGLIMLQPDLGTGIVIVITCLLMIFIAGVQVYRFIMFSFIGVIGFVYLIISAPYRIKRITAFLNPWRDPLGEGFQIIQSLYAIGPGKLIGVGFGNSLQKFFYLPEPQTDFIFSVVAEEFGFIGATSLLLLFLLFCYRGIYIAMNVQDLFARFVAFGIISMIMIQVLINISVVSGLIPVTGITLPFISYGGSSLTITLCSIGILLNISKFVKK